MGPGFESQPDHSDESASLWEALFLFQHDSELAQGRDGIKKEHNERSE